MAQVDVEKQTATAGSADTAHQDGVHDESKQCSATTNPEPSEKPQPVPSQPVQSYPSGFRFWSAVAALSLAVFLTTMDATILATATPYITNEFNSLDDIGWYANIYPMVICMTQLLYGKLSVRYPIRWIYTVAMLIFLVGSAVCASAPSSAALIGGRAIAGAGSSGLLVGAFSLVPFLAPPNKRPLFLSLMGAARALATTFGPLIGGALTERVTWRWIFWINLPLGGVIYAIFFLTIHPPPRSTEGRLSPKDFLRTLDLPGLLFLASSVVCLFLGLQWGGTVYAWGNARIIALLVLFGVLGIMFVAIEVKQKDKAMLPLRVFTQRTVLCACFYAITAGGGVYIVTYYFPIWLQSVKEKSPLQSGISTLPWVVTSMVVAIVGGVTISKLGYANVWMIIGSVFVSIGSGLFTTLRVNTPAANWIGYQIVYAVGGNLSSMTPLMVAQAAVPLADVPIGSGLLIFFQTIGGALFISVAQSLFTNNLSVGLQRLQISGFSASTVATGGISTLVQGLSGDARYDVLAVISSALTQSWLLPAVLSCLSLIGALGVEHRKVNQKGASS